MHKRNLRRLAVVAGTCVLTGAAAVPAMASFSVSNSPVGDLSEMNIGSDLVPAVLPALPSTAPALSPILGSTFGLLGTGGLIPSITGLLPNLSSPTSTVSGLSLAALTPLAALTTVSGTVSSLTSSSSIAGSLLSQVTGTNGLLSTVTGPTGVLNPVLGAVTGALGSM